MERILNEASKVADEAEVFCVTSEETPVQFEANRLKSVQIKQSTSVALRIIRNGRIGFATATNLKEYRNIVDSAVETAEFGMKAEFEFPAGSSLPDVKTYDSAIRRITTEDMTELGTKLIERVRAHTPEIQCEAHVNKAVINVRLINSRGTRIDHRHSNFSIGVEGQLIRGTDMLFVGESQSSCHPLDNVSTITNAVVQQLEYARNQAAVQTAEMPVIFTPEGLASAFIYPLMVGFSGKTVLEGSSPIGNKLGQKVFDETFSLIDDPLIDFQPGSRPVDDEGIASQRTPLVEGGVVSAFLYDLQTAGLAGTKSTGNGERHGGLPSPSPSVFVITPGTAAFRDMVADIKEGLVVEYLMGASQGNVLGGDFSGNVLLGYKIENGEITGRVKDTMVSGNVYSLLKDISVIGSESKWVSGSFSTPPVCFPKVSVAAS
ncbi:MAG: TldD/PmbA family protein [Dehalococcoidales bacterium]|nr:TldD/PmbA family protein [Dehalococcoidales bacterium]